MGTGRVSVVVGVLAMSVGFGIRVGMGMRVYSSVVLARGDSGGPDGSGRGRAGGRGRVKRRLGVGSASSLDQRSQIRLAHRRVRALLGL